MSYRDGMVSEISEEFETRVAVVLVENRGWKGLGGKEEEGEEDKEEIGDDHTEDSSRG